MTGQSFVQTESLTRRLSVTMVTIVIFFIVGIGATVVSNSNILEKIGDLNNTNSLFEITRQIKELSNSLNEQVLSHVEKDQSDKKTEVKAPTFFTASQDQLKDLFEQAFRLAPKGEVYNQLEEVKVALEDLNQSAKRMLTHKGDWRQEILIHKQYQVESNEYINKVQITLNAQSSQIFHDLYDARYQPIIAGVTLGIIFVIFSLYMGLGIARRISVAINNLLKTTNAVSSGNLNARAKIINPDEIGSLTHSFNEMIDSVNSTTVSKDLLERANKELEAFSYSVSHDLRAPLRGIDGFSLALIEELGPQLNDEMKMYLQRIRAGVQKMGALIDDMLNLSKLSRKEIVLSQVDMSAMVSEIVDELKETQPDRKTEIIIAPGIQAYADPALMHAVFENLLNNAWKYSSKAPVAKIEFGVTEQKGQTVYFIKDNGAGFDMAYYEKLFGAFQRLHTAEEFPGTGVGLATVQRIIHRHHGTIWAESAVNQGAKFLFTLGT